MMKYFALVLAAGKGTRMKTTLPKCVFPILKKPMIEYIVESIESSIIDETVVVVGHQKEAILDLLGNRVTYQTQTEQLGTGHAALSAKEALGAHKGVSLILLGDMPLINQKMIDRIIKYHVKNTHDLTVVTTHYDNPKGYGRIVRDESGQIMKIVEHIDCTDKQKLITEVNSGLYVIDNQLLFHWLEKIPVNPRKQEYYLTDIVELMLPHHDVGTFTVYDGHLLMGVNDLYGISIAEKYFRDQINRDHMLNGVSMVNPETITIGHNVTIESGVTINPNTTITGKSIIQKHAVIGPNTEIHNSVIHPYVTVKHSLVYDSTVLEHTTVGPFAHLRSRAHIGAYNRIGNFVEVKQSNLGAHTKASHLAYIGDAEVGHHVNFGCGSVTVNYDGVEKHQSIIGNDVFIGCNTNLIAPIEIGNSVFIAAGSTVTQNVPSNAFAIARNRQVNKADYYKHLIRPKPKNDK